MSRNLFFSYMKLRILYNCLGSDLIETSFAGIPHNCVHFEAHFLCGIDTLTFRPQYALVSQCSAICCESIINVNNIIGTTAFPSTYYGLFAFCAADGDDGVDDAIILDEVI